MSDQHLLPPSATAQERALSLTIERAADVPVLVREAWNPATCPAPLLPWLAWAFSVDEWRDEWTTEEKRGVIANALFIHKHKGTLAALKRAVAPLGYIIRITEWREEQASAAPYSFRLDVAVTDKGINETVYDQLERLIGTYKNVRSYMRRLTVKAEVSGPAYFGAAIMSGIVTTVSPLIVSDMQSIAAMYWGLGEQCVDTVTIFPN